MRHLLVILAFLNFVSPAYAIIDLNDLGIHKRAFLSEENLNSTSFWKEAMQLVVYYKNHRKKNSIDPIYSFKEFHIKQNQKQTLHGWEFVSDTTRPFIVYAHGRKGTFSVMNSSGRLKTLYTWAQKLKANLIIINYPGYGKSQGSPNEKSISQSVLAGLKRAKSYNQKSPIYLIGYSLGTGAATLANSQFPHPIDKLILIAPFSSALTFGQKTLKSTFNLVAQKYVLEHHEFNSLDALLKKSQPTLIIHGSKDQVIAPYNSQEIFLTFEKKARSVGYKKLSPKGRILKASQAYKTPEFVFSDPLTQIFEYSQAHHTNIWKIAEKDIFKFLRGKPLSSSTSSALITPNKALLYRESL